MSSNIEICRFLNILYNALNSQNFYMLSTDSPDKIQAGKILMGYYDDEYLYIFPSIITAYADSVTTAANMPKINMHRVLKGLFALNLIKVHWVLSKEVRYRPQKRVADTRNRYITFCRKSLADYYSDKFGKELKI